MQVFFYCSCFEWRLVHRLQIHRSVEGSSEVLIIIIFFKFSLRSTGMRKLNPKKRSISTPLVLTVLKSKQVMFPSPLTPVTNTICFVIFQLQIQLATGSNMNREISTQYRRYARSLQRNSCFISRATTTECLFVRLHAFGTLIEFGCFETVT